MDYDYRNGKQGLRPIVCLKSNIQLEKQDDGTFKIIRIPVTAEDISKMPSAYYGAEVINYDAPYTGVNNWRIFYADNTNIYLISDDYIEGVNAPEGQAGSKLEIDNYDLSFANVINDYEGAKWIKENSKGSKWLSQYLSSYDSSTYENIRAVAYMMDTNVWSAYYAGEDAEYAMGGPTIEMFCASYKDTHPSKYLECGNVDADGYQVRWNGGDWYWSQSGLVQDDFNGIYVKSDTSKADSVWIASPSNFNDASLIVTYYKGYVSNIGYTSGTGLRPLVCLKSNIQLEKQDNERYMIVK